MGWKLQAVVVIGIGIAIGFFNFRLHEIDDDILVKYLEKDGYQADSYRITTEDGYILAMHRLKRGPGKGHDAENSGPRPPVLIVHGLQSSSSDFVRFLKNASLPYLLFEKGYDVWFGDCRGAPGSMKHVSLDPQKDAAKYWNYSVHEIGYYDIPKMIDHVLETTAFKKLFYIGISQGTSAFLILTSTRSEYNEKVELAHLLSPASHLANSKNIVFRVFAHNWPTLLVLADLFGVHQALLGDRLRTICRLKFMTPVCKHYLDNTIGYFNPSVSLETIEEMLQLYPARASLKQSVHFLQFHKSGDNNFFSNPSKKSFSVSGKFRPFDYGEGVNIRKYGMPEPPDYDLKRISVPIALYWGENDCWMTPEDFKLLEEELSNVVVSFKHPNKLFNHAGFQTDMESICASQKMIETTEKYRVINKST